MPGEPIRSHRTDSNVSLISLKHTSPKIGGKARNAYTHAAADRSCVMVGLHLVFVYQGNFMSDAALTIEQCRQLIHELATNDDFRRRYEDKPAAALVELGIPFHVVVNLKASCLVSRRLGSKEIFERANRQLSDDIAQKFASFHTPSVWIESPQK